MKPGPYQYCNECETERAHGWISENTFQCIACNKETTVKDRPPIPREAIFPGIGKITPMEEIAGKDHLQKEELEELTQKLASEPKAVQSEPKKVETPDPMASTAFESPLPKMGYEIKATPLEEKHTNICLYATKEEIVLSDNVFVHGNTIYAHSKNDVTIGLTSKGLAYNQNGIKGFIYKFSRNLQQGEYPKAGQTFSAWSASIEKLKSTIQEFFENPKVKESFPTVTTDKHGNTHFKSKNMDIWTGPGGTKQMEDAMRGSVNTAEPTMHYPQNAEEHQAFQDAAEPGPKSFIGHNEAELKETLEEKPKPSTGGWADDL